MSTDTAAAPVESTPTAPETKRARKRRKFSPWSVVAWIVALGFFFPVAGWCSPRSSRRATPTPTPPKLFFTPTLDQFGNVFDSGIGTALLNSAFATAMSTILVLVLGVPAAFALSMRPVRKTKDALFFFITTKMLPIVAAIIPLYVIVNDIGLLDNIWALIILYTAMNLPIAVWMMRSFFLEVPSEVLEAASMDGASLWTSVREVMLPLVSPGHRRDRADLRDLLVERVLLRGQPHRRAGRTDAGVPRRLHHQRGPVLGPAVGSGDAGRAPGHPGRLGRAEQAGPRPVLRCDQMITPATTSPDFGTHKRSNHG